MDFTTQLLLQASQIKAWKEHSKTARTRGSLFQVSSFLAYLPPLLIFKLNLAIEWVNETFTRTVLVQLDFARQEVRVEKPRGGILRRLSLAHTQTIAITVSNSKTHPFVMISVPKNYDIVSVFYQFNYKKAVYTSVCLGTPTTQ